MRKGDDWYIPRADGSTTILPETAIDEWEQLQPAQAIIQYAAQRPLSVVIAGADDVLGPQDYGSIQRCPGVALRTIAGATHNFTGPARGELVRLVGELLQVS